ncbi:uncharacterized protein STEHIDRAFT_139826 [Stereum hirsutum FP-91666 SS1]|uniref:uncharacterized protein n=1 Tax=Stereum hirsutum (strain FP-91666) TaxID=721885 RepID=UPI0004449419|nr:uncharacterized protein STEHIDRAFT_139826 [Stereum hirsutum FP-91666 SS1]EIM86040.1 hypothetical protein STEHIDRAFT_139826 [Stereum hirsutum FP-91666 SS1]
MLSALESSSPRKQDCICGPTQRIALETPANNLDIWGKRFKYDQFNQIDIPYYRALLASFDISSAQHYPRHVYLSFLAYALQFHFEELGQINDLSEAIVYHREVLSSLPSNHPAVLPTLKGLSVALHQRFRLLGIRKDFEEAITYQLKNSTPDRSCRCGRPMSHKPLHRHGSAMNLTVIPSNRRIKRLSLTDSPCCPESHQGYIPLLSQDEHHRLDDVIASLRQDLERLPGNIDRSPPVNELGFILRTRFEKTGRVDDLDESVACHQEALFLRPVGDARRSMTLVDLAQAVAVRFELHKETEDLHTSLHFFEEAVYDLFGSPKVAFRAAQDWASYAHRYRHPSALTAYLKALILLDRCSIMYPTLDLQQKSISPHNLSSLAVDAASAAIGDGDLRKAVEFLEQGRALLWSRMRGYRHPIERLRPVHRALADRFENICRELEIIATSFERPEVDVPVRGHRVSMGRDNSFEFVCTRYRELLGVFDAVIGEIRHIDGYSDFMRPKSFSRLQQAAVEGPVVILNLSVHRSDALILPDANSEPVVVPLSSSPKFPRYISQLSSLLYTLTTKRSDEARAEGVKSILKRLWALVVQPIATRLSDLGVPRGARIWWCPTGALCSLPVHAAQPFDNERTGLHDLYTSSYTPTLSSLITSRTSLRSSRSDAPCLLAVGQVDDSLPRVQEELKAVQTSAAFVRQRIGKDATADNVALALRDYPWLHLACHGHLDPQSFASSFKLHDSTRLRVIDIIKARLPNAEFAFLSACHSAAVDSRGSPDEVLHLAAAMQFSGFKSVVGTLWGMADDDGPRLAEAFYGYLFRYGDPSKVDFRDSATALRVATKALRRAKVPIDRWVNFNYYHSTARQNLVKIQQSPE